MSRRLASAAAARRVRLHAPVFAALGDETRLSIVARLSEGAPQSITQLSDRTKITRQAVTKHLRVLEGARIVRSERAGRETLFELDPEPLDAAEEYLHRVSRQWDHALARLKAFVDD